MDEPDQDAHDRTPEEGRGTSRDDALTPGAVEPDVARRPGDTDGGGRTPGWHPTTKIAAGVGLAVAGVGGVYLARNALTVVAMAGLLAFLVAPLIRFLQVRARFPKVLALLTSYLVMLLVTVLLGAFVVSGLVSSFSEIDPEEAAESLRSTGVDVLSSLRTIPIAGYEIDLSETFDPLIEDLEDTSLPLDTDEEEVEPAGPTTITVGGQQFDVLLGQLMTSAQTLGGVLTALIVTFLVALYLSADSHKFHAGLLAHVPDGYHDDARRMNDRIGTIWRGYLYGQLVNSLATGLLVWLVLWGIGLPGAFVFGLVMAVLNMIPTFGPIIAAVPGVLAALALGSTRFDWSAPTFALLVVVIYVLVVQAQANLMAPFIIGQAVSMSPATILVGLLVGFQVGGLVGTLLVVPVLSTIKEIGLYVLAKLLDRDPFADPTLEAAT